MTCVTAHDCLSFHSSVLPKEQNSQFKPRVQCASVEIPGAENRNVSQTVVSHLETCAILGISTNI